MSSAPQLADVSTSNVNVNDKNTGTQTLPPPPIPSKDPKLLEAAAALGQRPASSDRRRNDGIFGITPMQALELLGSSIEDLVAATGDVPPTPPPRSPTLPNMRGMDAEKQNLVRSASEKNLARLRSGSISSPRPGKSPRKLGSSTAATVRPATPTRNPSIDGVQLRTPTRQMSSHPTPAQTPEPQQEPYVVIGANSQPLNMQHSAITRKFYSKQPPPISIGDYLRRMHRFCPMSTAVYLATSLYIHRLAVTEGAIAVTTRNAHRLLLAGLRIAMKALEDVSFPHEKVARVGGVSQAELARLEISFCFLTGFELVVTEDRLKEHWEMLKTEVVM